MESIKTARALLGLLAAMALLWGCALGPSFKYTETPEGGIEASGSSIAFLRDEVIDPETGGGYIQLRILPSRSVDDQFSIITRDLDNGGTEVVIIKDVGEGRGWASVVDSLDLGLGFLTGVLFML